MKKLIFSLALVSFSLTTHADAIEVNGIFYNLNSNIEGAAVTSSIDKYKGDLVIPHEIVINGKTINVTSIDEGAFSDCVNLTSVKIPSSITYIAAGSFAGCDELSSITVDKANMVYDSRGNCNAIIETATNTLVVGCNASTIPYSAKIIGSYAFSKCRNLNTIDIPNTVESIYSNAFSESGLISIEIPNSITGIPDEAFSWCSQLTSISLPNSITYIGYAAFRQCKLLSSIELPENLNRIGQYAFDQTGLKSLIIPQGITSIGEWAFYACHSLHDVTIRNNIEEIAGNAFAYCVNLEIVCLPYTLSKLGNGSFDGCWALTDVYCFAENVPEIQPTSFPLSLNNINLHVPESSVSSYSSANVWRDFSNIVALSNEDIAKYGDNSPKITIKNKVEGIYQVQATSDRDGVVYGSDFEIVVLDNGDGSYYVDDLFGGWYSKRAGYGANYSMTGTIEVAVDGKISLKESYVNGWGDSLNQLTGSYDSSSSSFSINAVYVDQYQFNQTWIKVGDIIQQDGIVYGFDKNNTVFVTRGKYSGNIVIPDKISHDGVSYTVTSIKDAFGGAYGVTSVTIPNSVTSLGDFSGCENLVSINIPNSVTSIGDFSGCTSLISIDIPDGITTLKGFNNCTSLTTINIPSSVTLIDGYSFGVCTSLSNLNLPNSITTIGESSFMQCSGLKSLTIPESVLNIAMGAFSECVNLESIKVDKANSKYDSRNNCNAVIETHTKRLVLGCKNTVIPSDITTIGAIAFEFSDEKSFLIPDNIISIEWSAYSLCKNLESITLGKGILSIERSFTSCPNLKDFYCYAETVPNTDIDAFMETPIENATLHVPASSIDAYKLTAPWSGFGRIVALTSDDPQTTSIRIQESADGIYPVEIHSLDGRSTSHAQRGLNIIRMSDGTIKKVVLK